MRVSRVALCSVWILIAGACSDDDPPGVSQPDAAVPGDGPGTEPGDGGEIVELPPLGPGVGTLAGQGARGFVDGERNQALFHNPANVCVGPDGRVYVADFDNGAIRVVTPEGNVSTLIGNDATFSRPFGMVFVDDQTMIVQTDWNTAGRRGGTLWRVNAGTGQKSVIVEDTGRYRGLAALPDGRVAMADYQAHTVNVLDPQSGAITVLAGAHEAPGYVDGAGAAARFDKPYDVVVAPDGSLIVSDQGNNRLRRVTMSGEVSSFAGNGQRADVDGGLAHAAFNEPQGLASDAAGNIYVTSRGGYVLRKVDTQGQVTTIAGDGNAGWVDSEDPRKARFFGLEGLDVTSDGRYLYVADGSRGENVAFHRVRRQQL